eukprot:scaffold31250_cov79-Isochrysis_galbana.AAC.1
MGASASWEGGGSGVNGALGSGAGERASTRGCPALEIKDSRACAPGRRRRRAAGADAVAVGARAPAWGRGLVPLPGRRGGRARCARRRRIGGQRRT